MPESTSSLPPAATKLSTCRITTARGRLLEGPRVKGITQNVQRLPHPSWIFRLGRVCAPGASWRFLKKGVREAIVGPDRGRTVPDAPPSCSASTERSDSHRDQCWRAARSGLRRVERLKNDLRRQRLVAVAHHRGHAGHRGQFLGRALRIAAGDDNLGLGIAAVRAADEGACGAIGLGRHAACVHDHHIGCEGLALG